MLILQAFNLVRLRVTKWSLDIYYCNRSSFICLEQICKSWRKLKFQGTQIKILKFSKGARNDKRYIRWQCIIHNINALPKCRRNDIRYLEIDNVRRLWRSETQGCPAIQRTHTMWRSYFKITNWAGGAKMSTWLKRRSTLGSWVFEYIKCFWVHENSWWP